NISRVDIGDRKIQQPALPDELLNNSERSGVTSPLFFSKREFLCNRPQSCHDFAIIVPMVNVMTITSRTYPI
ncbi:MAG: hypothetical protein ABR542_04545, partial [Desulfonatronovibrio sp.]